MLEELEAYYDTMPVGSWTNLIPCPVPGTIPNISGFYDESTHIHAN